MVELVETTLLKLDAAQAWERIGAFGAVGDWHPMLAKVTSEGNEAGSLRHAVTTDGGRQVERLTSYDDLARRYSYEMAETALPVFNYTAEFLIAEAPGGCLVSWSARFEVSSGDRREGEEMIRQFLRAGLDALAERYG